MREYKIRAITFAVVLCFLLTALLITDTVFPKNELSKDKILERPEETVLASPDSFVTLTFTGTITQVGVQCLPPDVFADAAIGDTWTLTYTFDTSAFDVDGSATAGQYRNLIPDMTLKIGSTTVSGTPGTAIPGELSSRISVNLGPGYADYSVSAGLPDSSAWAQVSLRDDTGTPFTDDSLPLSIPTPLEANFPTQRQFLLRAMGSTQICIMGTVEGTFTPPEITIGSMIDAIDAFVSSGVLMAGVGDSLTTKLENAIDLLNRDNNRAASLILGAFIEQVEALVSSGRLPEEEGQELIVQAEEVIGDLGAT